MNILLFVTCFLMMLSLVTYAKVDSFRYFLGTQAQFERYMSSIEQTYSNKIGQQWYKATVANKKSQQNEPTIPSTPKDDADKDQEDKPPQKYSRASRLMPIRILLDPEMQAKNRETYDLVNQWTKNLIHNLYGKYPFFVEALKKKPRLVEELLEKIASAYESLPPENRPKQVTDLANLDVGPDLERIFYLMLKGCSSTPAKDKKLQKEAAIVQQQKGAALNIIVDESEEDESEVAEAAVEEPIIDKKDSLLLYISIPKTTKIRVFLAPKEVLQAIFNNEDIADNIIERRYALYQSVLQGETTEQASIQFKFEFQSYIRSSDENLLDFRVTKTNPLYYNANFSKNL